VLQTLPAGVAKVTLESTSHTDSKGGMPRASQHTALTSIVAIDKNGAIGCQNSLPWRLKSDLAFFRKTTIGNTVVMGRKTYDSIGCCLPKRNNIVLSHSYNLFEDTSECALVHSIDEALFHASGRRMGQAFVIGGAATYAQFAHLVDKYVVTFVDHHAEDADAFLASEILDDLHSWVGTEIASFQPSPEIDEFGFRIVEFSAPDAEARQAERSRLIANFSERTKKQVQPRSKPSLDTCVGSQVAFGF
jgi:dihydrofolate reductase